MYKRQYEYSHDEVGYNYRMPNINAALGCAQMEQLDSVLKNKKELAVLYAEFFKHSDINFISEPINSISNYWLNAVTFADKKERDAFLKDTNDAGIMTRPIWQLMNRLEMFESCQANNLPNAYWLEDRVVNIPSGVRL